MEKGKPEANRARRVAAECFTATLRTLFGKPGITEQEFARQWSTELAARSGISTNGWYDPPPNGMAVLSGIPRITFTSLRDKENWPGDEVIDWKNGALFAYCSPVSIDSRTLGDFVATLYFGDDEVIKRHFARTYRAIWEVLDIARIETSSRRLFQRSEEIFSRYGLRNSVLSVTDTVALDLGHTYPILEGIEFDAGGALSPASRDRFRHARRYLNDDSDWDLLGPEQFTIEPQLISTTDLTLPQVSYHYVVVPGTREILCEEDSLLREFGLTA